jgi:ABC-type antimicrobial peptide transport system permease subunit
MSGVRWRAVQNERYRTGILLAFAGIATLLATIGIFGVVAYNVVQRRREIGLRIALGARAMDVRRVVLSVAVLPVAVGVVAGLAVSLVLTRLLESFLYEITPSDTTTLATAVGPFSRRGLSGRTHSCSPGIAY